jgi:hypothetical protein
MPTWYERNKERVRATNAARYARNKEAEKAAAKAWSRANPERVKSTKQKYYAINNERMKAEVTAYRKEHSKEQHARNIVANAIKFDRLVPLPCWICGKERAEAHHPNYDAPLDVIWLCRSHHKQLHKEFSMANDVTIFDTPQQLPAYLQTSEAAKALAAQTSGGLEGGISINRISLRGSRFRFNKEGVEIGVSPHTHLDVVVLAANPHVSRVYYAKAFNPDDAGTRPDCYSKDGRTPEEDSPSKQADACAICPQNVKGSAVSSGGKGKACSYKKRLIVAADGDITGDAYALDVAAMGLFGDDDPSQKKFNLRSLIEALKANGLIVPSVVTRISFDDQSSVPKLLFKPVRPLSAEEWKQVEGRLNDPEIRKMLDDIDNKTEEGKPVGQIAAPTPKVPAAPVAGNGGAIPARRGRPIKTEAAPVPAPTPEPKQAGFGFGTAPTKAAPAPVVAQPAGGFSVNLDDFDN